MTYPGHYLQTALTIQSYLKFHSPESVTVIVDDINEHAWQTYQQDCATFYNARIIPASRLDSRSLFDGVPWIRQQLVKLYLDQLLDFEQWFFTDGDVQFNFPIAKDTVPYTYTDGGLVQQQQNNYVTRMLNLSDPGIFVDKQVCVSNPPFRFMDAKTLQDLRQHVEHIHGINFLDLHWQISFDTKTIGQYQYYSISEWELLATFATRVQGRSLNLQYYPTYDLKDRVVPTSTHPDYINTCYNTDQEIGREWFESRNIKCSDAVWNEICKITK
jgi:hypothetical protein